LQHDGFLAWDHAGQQHDLPVGKLEGVVVGVPLVGIDLSKAGHPGGHLATREEKVKLRIVLNVVFERDLGPREKANRDGGLFGSCKTAGKRVGKCGRNQFFADPCGSRRNVV
jgi:hypothetical protein